MTKDRPDGEAVDGRLEALLAGGRVELASETRTSILAAVGLDTATTYQLAQLNIAKFRAPMDDPMLADFVAALDPINHLAEDAPGFVWRLTGEGSNDATSITFYDDPLLLVNMSVWSDVESLHRYVYRSAHTKLLKRRREWAVTLDEVHLVLWWVPVGHTPDLVEANERLALLQTEGPTEAAFTFAHRFPPPDERPDSAGPASEIS